MRMTYGQKALISLIIFGFFFVLCITKMLYPINRWDDALAAPIEDALAAVDSVSFETQKGIALSVLEHHGCNLEPKDDCTSYYERLKATSFENRRDRKLFLSDLGGSTRAPANYWAHREHGYVAFLQITSIFGMLVSIIMTIAYASEL